MIIDDIRIATSATHKELDQSLMPLFQKINSIEDYAVLLKAFYSFFKPVTDKIDKYIDLNYLPDYQERRRPERIIDDLKILNQPTSDIALTNTLPDVSNASQAFGALYVIEGSTLGGVFLSKIIAEKINIDADKGLSFFYGYGKESREKWNNFIDCINKFASDTNSNKDIIDTAENTFAFFKKHLQDKINI